MNKTISVRGLSFHVEMRGDTNLPTIVFLHGFTGSTQTWRDVRNELNGVCRTIAIDLTGHGQTTVPDNPARYAMEEQIEDLHSLFNELSLDSFYLVGYSMGGRIALAYSVQYPESVIGLILESASPGLEEEASRIARRQADEALAERIMTDGIEPFVNFWEGIPLFDSQKRLPAEKRQAIREERLRQSETGLANSLKGIGTGSQQSYWNQLHSLSMPVFLLVGELDTKFVAIAQEMKNCVPSWRLAVVPDVGHAIHVENPSNFATMIKEYLQHLQLEEE